MDMESGRVEDNSPSSLNTFTKSNRIYLNNPRTCCAYTVTRKRQHPDMNLKVQNITQ